MIYVNKKTGATIDSPTPIFGGNYIEKSLLEKTKNVKAIEKEKTKEDIRKEKEDFTKNEIMNELNALGIEYDKTAKKEELYRLMVCE